MQTETKIYAKLDAIANSHEMDANNGNKIDPSHLI